MNEYAYYGKGHTIHSSGQIEWHTNTVDDKSVQVGGQQRSITIDGYSMPLMCRDGLMYFKFQGIPTDTDLQTYPSVHVTSPQQWDPSVLDYVHPKDNGEPNSTYDLIEEFQIDPTFDEFDDYINKLLSITPQISSTHNLLVNKHTTLWGGTVDFFPMKRHLKNWDSKGRFPHDPGGTIICQLIKFSKGSLQSKWIYLHYFILYTRNFLHENGSKYCIMGVSMKINNENETYTIHFIFHTNIHHIKSSRIRVMENNVNIT